MELMRTANAGVLLKLDNASILIDGVCREVSPYPATPLWVKQKLCDLLPDAVCFTHAHGDHYDPDFAALYRTMTRRPIVAPPEMGGCQRLQVGDVSVTAVNSRHIGKAGADTPHVSFVIRGSQCVWALGDSSPLQWQGREDLPKPDVLLVPYAYACTEKGWQIARSLGARKTVLLHMPPRDNDPAQLWPAVRTVAGEELGKNLVYLELGQQCSL